jgi:hypothetical protein
VRKQRSGDSASSRSFSVGDDFEAVFARYKAAYPDYRGLRKDFLRACSLLKNLTTAGQRLHRFLYDDAIFHHHHSFRQYLVEEGMDEVQAPLSFLEFYHERVHAPSHRDRIVENLDIVFPSHDKKRNRSASNSGPEGRSLRLSSLSVTPRREESTTEKGDNQMKESPADVVLENDASEQPIELVEDQGRELSDAASPELGTPNVDRSLPATPPTDLSTRIDDALAASSMKGNMQPLLTDLPASSPPGEQAAMSSSRGIPSSGVSRLARRGRPSASPFTKPAKPIPHTKATQETRSTMPSIGRSPAWWLDKNTPFRRFEKDYSSLSCEKSAQRQIAADSGGIDLASWRT